MSKHNNEIHWLKSSLMIQIHRVRQGESERFPCNTDFEKEASLKAIRGFQKLIDESKEAYS
ncbi:hypothetical protein [Bacillus sp. Brlt_9]|uniref:hypothetical protein n=1 Tax=Bacillus sp. Brlt_9 TaxID=3110916 RepID=UPI003F7B464E